MKLIIALLILCMNHEIYAGNDDEDHNFIPNMNGDDTIHILSYNVQCLGGLLTPFANTSTRADILVNFVSELIVERGVDVIVFQELFKIDVYTKFVEKLTSILPYNTGVIGEVGEIYQWNTYYTERSRSPIVYNNGGVCIFSKYPIVEKHQLTFKDYTGTCGLSYKGAALAVINKNGVFFNIIGTHLQAFDEEKHKNVRVLQMNELDSWLGLIFNKNIESSLGPYHASNESPIILAGDLNTCCIEHLPLFNSLVNVDRNYPLQCTFTPSNPPIPTYDTSENDFCKLQNGNEEYRLVYDYILKSDKLVIVVPQTTIKKKLIEPLRVKMYVGYVFRTGYGTIYDISDHFPIFSVLKVKR